ncbi:MAG: TolC family protein [Bacteroidetes bacterium]|nr:TolC family protein [Bacteroidota bacterium]
MYLSLEECIKYAEKNNLTLKTAALDKEKANISFEQSKRAYAPSISASASQSLGYSNGVSDNNFSASGSYSIGANMTLFDGFNTQTNIKQNELNLTQADLQLAQNQDNINVQIIQAFLTVLMNKELLDYQQTVVKTSEEQYNQGKAQLAVGKILESDFMLLNSQYQSDLFNIENTKITIENNILELKNLLNIDHNTTLDIKKPDTAAIKALLELPSLDYILSQAINYLPIIKIRANNVKLAEYDIDLAKSSYYPTLGLSAGVSTGYRNKNGSFGGQLTDNLGENLGLSLNIPIYSKGNVDSKVQQSQVALQKALIAQENAKLEGIQTIEKAYLTTQRSLNNYNNNFVFTLCHNI